MGHTRLGSIPKTRKWTELIGFMAEGEAVASGEDVHLSELADVIAGKAVDAAEAGLRNAVQDSGFRHAFFLLTQIVLAARRPDWQQRLLSLGLRLEHESTVFDLAAELQYLIDDHIRDRGTRTDISEMAQAALGEAVIQTAGPWSETLFGAGRDELIGALQRFSTRVGFAQLGQAFFSAFMFRFLNFHLSRVTAAQTGSRLTQVGDLTRFNDALRLHCDQTAYIVRDFCGQWYSKTEYKEGITPRNVAQFIAVAIRKLQDELCRQGAANG